MGRIDLHTHSCFSDGQLSPGELVRLAASSDIMTLALTDHDTVAGLNQAIEEGIRFGITVIPAIEITAGDNSGEYHILGYHIEKDAPDFLQDVNQLWENRLQRNMRLLENLSKVGFRISLADVEKTVGFKWHDRKDIARTLVALGHLGSTQEAFTEKLLGESSPLYLPAPVVSPHDAIRVVRSGGGIPVLAHPGARPGGKREAYPIPEAKIREFRKMGLMGLEAYYSRHSLEDISTYVQMASRLGLAVTGGSDFHSLAPRQPGLGQIDVPSDVLQVLEHLVKPS